MAYGDHIYVVRPQGHSHHGIDVGGDRVIHRSSPDGRKRTSTIRETSLAEFLDGGTLRIRRYGRCLSRDDAVARARSMLDQGGYDLLSNNCEHFATWCVTGQQTSAQVDTALSGAGVAGAGIGGPSAGLSLVTACGEGCALSAPNLMSGLVAIGGSVVGGVAVTGAAIGLTTAYGVCRMLPDHAFLPEDERAARAKARTAAGAGAVGGTALSIYAVGAMGIPGFSAVGLSSGFASLGGVTGGGMAAGIVTALALPGALALALGLLVYFLMRRRAEKTDTALGIAITAGCASASPQYRF